MDKKTKKIFWFVARYVLAALVIGLVFYLGKVDLKPLYREGVKWGYIATGFLLTLAIVAVGVVRWRMLLGTQGANVSLSQVMRLNFIGYFFNLCVPGATGGDVVKAYYVATIFPDKKAEVVTTVFLDRILGLYGLFFLATFFLLTGFNRFWAYEKLRPIIILLLAVDFIGIFVAVLLFSKPVRESARLRALGSRLPGSGVLKRIYSAVDAYRTRLGQVALAVFLSLIAHSVNVLANFFYLRGLGIYEIDFWTVFLIVPLALFINAIPLVPMGLGIGEAAYGTLFGLVAVQSVAAQTVLAAVLMHLSFMSFGFIGIIPYIQGRNRIAAAIAAAEADEEIEDKSGD